jgi:undecaprenyl-diphosphatase
MLETLKTIDEKAFLFLNAHHSAFFDQVMWLLSDKFFWVPLYLWFLWILYKQYPRHYWTVILSVILLIVISDQLCNLSKESFMRFRPSQDPRIGAMAHIVRGYRGGMYGFYSGHSSNAFAIAIFIITVASRNRKYVIPVALLYAILTAYSRVYLGVHYPGDILTGAIIGVLLGLGIACAHGKLRERYLTPLHIPDSHL